MQWAGIDGALGGYWVILLCLWIHMLEEDLKVPSSGPKRKQEIVRFSEKNSELRARRPQVLLQLCC